MFTDKNLVAVCDNELHIFKVSAQKGAIYFKHDISVPWKGISGHETCVRLRPEEATVLGSLLLAKAKEAEKTK